MLLKLNHAKIHRNLGYLIKDLEQFGFKCSTTEVEVNRTRGLQLHVIHRGTPVIAANLLAGGRTGHIDWSAAKQQIINAIKDYGLEEVVLHSLEPA